MKLPLVTKCHFSDVMERDRKYPRVKEDLAKHITPVGLVPLATGTAFLILGSRGENSCPGHPSLPTFLLLAGTLTIGLGVMTYVGKFIVNFGLPTEERELTPEEERVVWLLRHFRHVLSASQVVLLVTGTIIIAPLASTLHPWDFTNPNAKYYCDYGTVVFSAIFFPVMWLMLFLTVLGYICIKCSIADEE